MALGTATPGCALDGVSNRALKRQFDAGDDYVEDVKEALVYSHAEHITDDGRGLIWSGEPREPLPDTQPETDRETRLGDWERFAGLSRPD